MKNKLDVVLRTALIILFTYAGLVKLVDVNLFQQQLFQSPVIGRALVPFVSYALPAFELALVACLLSDRLFKIGFLLSFLTMLFFTFYLIGIVSFATHVPCSCGGILGHMSYPVHITFNIIFTLISLYMLMRYKDGAGPDAQPA